jgi:hypothetical protein
VDAILQELSARLTEVAERRRLKEKLERDLIAVEAELSESSGRVAALLAQLEREKVDVDKLERVGLAALFHSILGDRERQLEKERQELLLAQLLYRQGREQVERLERERIDLSRRLEGMAGLDSEYEALLSEKERAIRRTSSVAAGPLLEISEQLASVRSELSEIREAVSAGEGAVSRLDDALESLKKAEGWGGWDMLGGGLIADSIKHSHIDDACASVSEAKAMIDQFRRELAEVRVDAELHIEIGGFATFADFFFDGLISDWVVQSKIEDSLQRTGEVRGAVLQAMTELDRQRERAEKRYAELQELRAKLVENN